MDVFEEIFKRQEFENNGIEYDLELKDGIFQAIVKDPDPSFLENIGEGLERVAGTTASIGAGAVGATLGFPTDLASLFASIGKSVGAEDGKKLETFANTFETLSRENYGSQFYKKYFDSFVDDLNVSDQKKEDFKSGFVAGEFLGVGNVGKEAAKQAPTVAKSIKETSEQVGEAAQKRVDENQGSMTMSSMGVGEMGKMVDKGLSKLAPNKGEVVDINKKVKQVVDIRAEQMKLPIKDRVQPSGEQFFNRNYKTQTADQTEIETPSIDETKPFPKNNRAKKLESFSDQIASTIANKLKDKVGSNEQFFYNTQPLIDKATELGIPEDVAKKQLEKLSSNYAATSPKSATEENLRSASLVSAKQTAKIPVDSVIGSGTVDPKTGKKGISEKGYPMMISPGGTHRKLVDAVAAEGLNVNTQPKPYSFAKNVQGNLNGVTVDSHAIRAVIFVLNDLEPGKVPIEFILPKFQKQYKKNPTKLTFDMIDASFATQARNKISYKPEYKIFSDIYKKVANNLSIKPAEAQALTWFNYGDRTGLVSKPKTFVDILEERIDVTAQLTNDSKDNVFKQFMQGKLPLLSLGGITLLETGTSMENE
tara:strand:- start:243 stop:2021 length:1779 start_codon:yes stop_codon:yes gene_type:complete